MADATVRFTWTKSASTDVVKQNFSVSCQPADGSPAHEQAFELGPTVELLEVTVHENETCTATLTAEDAAGNVSAPATVTFNVGDLTQPLPPTNLAFEIVDVSGPSPDPVPDPDDGSGPGPAP